MSWDLSKRLERCRPSDPGLDYCLWPYERPKPEADFALRTSTLLYHSFHVAGVSDRMLAACDALRETFGRFNTVWGVKWTGERISWEFYFYDYNRAERRRGVEAFLKATEGILHCSVSPDDSTPYFMFSVEFDDRHARGEETIDQIDIYMGNPGSTVSSGICYGLSSAGYEMRNLYFFFNAETEKQAIAGKIAATVHLPFRKTPVEQILWPEMEGVQTVVVANKRHNDGLYFSRISVNQLILFMDRLKFPDALGKFIRENQEALAHHLFDVGYDYKSEGEGEETAIKYHKGSYYGLL